MKRTVIAAVAAALLFCGCSEVKEHDVQTLPAMTSGSLTDESTETSAAEEIVTEESSVSSEERTETVTESETTVMAENVTEETQSETEETAQETEPAAAESGSGVSAFLGNWYEPIAGRGYMTVTETEGGCHLQVNRGSSAFEMAAWDIDAVYDESTGTLSYDSGTYRLLTFAEDGSDTVTEERTVQGTLEIDDRGMLLWADNAYENDEPYEFAHE